MDWIAGLAAGFLLAPIGGFHESLAADPPPPSTWQVSDFPIRNAEKLLKVTDPSPANPRFADALVSKIEIQDALELMGRHDLVQSILKDGVPQDAVDKADFSEVDSKTLGKYLGSDKKPGAILNRLIKDGRINHYSIPSNYPQALADAERPGDILWNRARSEQANRLYQRFDAKSSDDRMEVETDRAKGKKLKVDVALPPRTVTLVVARQSLSNDGKPGPAEKLMRCIVNGAVYGPDPANLKIRDFQMAAQASAGASADPRSLVALKKVKTRIAEEGRGCPSPLMTAYLQELDADKAKDPKHWPKIQLQVEAVSVDPSASLYDERGLPYKPTDGSVTAPAAATGAR